jgi:hypothetical protein
MHARNSSHRVFASVALAATLVLLPVTASVTRAQGRPATGLSAPITGTATAADGTVQTVTGTFTILRFAHVEDQIFAVGTVVGTVTSAIPGGPAQTFVTQVAMPLVRPDAGAAPAASAAPGDVTAMQVCNILNLVLGPLDLNLLGLEVHLNQVILDIVAVTGAGNLLGNLLCAIVGLLDGGGAAGQIVTLLNQVLGILG